MLITSLGTQLRVVDLERSVRFYVDRLGFKEDFRFRDFYAGLKAGGTSVHLKRIDGLDPSIAFVQAGDHLHLYLRVTDLDAAYAELHGNVEIVYPITTKPWGDREFTIRDPDGHTIYIGQAPSDTSTGSPSVAWATVDTPGKVRAAQHGVQLADLSVRFALPLVPAA